VNITWAGDDSRDQLKKTFQAEGIPYVRVYDRSGKLAGQGYDVDIVRDALQP